VKNPFKIISNHDNLVNQLVNELQQKLSLTTDLEDEQIAVVLWYMRCGYSKSINRERLIFALNNLPDIKRLAESIDPENISQGRPSPEFAQGQKVKVIVNAKNTTYHCGVITSCIWHHKDRKWIYQIHAEGKRVSKRYEALDLQVFSD
jgi:hypothetical protein